MQWTDAAVLLLVVGAICAILIPTESGEDRRDFD